MKIIRKVYIPSIAIAFTLGILISSVINIIAGYNHGGQKSFVLEYLLFIIAVEGFDYVIGRISKTYLQYYIGEYFAMLALFFGCAYVFQWFAFTLLNIISNILIATSIYLYIHYHFYSLRKQEANEINNLIKKNSEKGEDKDKQGDLQNLP